MRYYINGWKESRSYFFSLGRFTEEEYAELLSGNVISKGDNDFWIELTE